MNSCFWRLCFAMTLWLASLGLAGAETGVTNLVNGTTNTIGTSFSVGTDGSFNTLVITNAGRVNVSNSSSYIGRLAGANSNLALVTCSGSVWSNAVDLNIGCTGSFNNLIVTNAGNVIVKNCSYIGNQSDASSNSVVVAGSGSVWTNGLYLYVGSAGSGNSLSIINSGLVYDSDATIGYYASSSNNLVLVSGSGSVWDNANSLGVGYQGSGNSLIIANGGQVRCDGVSYANVVGDTASSSNNSVLVSGVGSSWLNTCGTPQIGYNGSGNSMTIVNGGQVQNRNGEIGYTSSSSNNSVVVSGADSVWVNTGNLYVGGAGLSNSLMIALGGLVQDSIGYVGQGGVSNAVRVIGSGSIWSNASQLYVGYAGESHSLTIADGGWVQNSNAFVGYVPHADSNTVLVNGAGSVWSNAGFLTVGNAGKCNSLMITNGGLVQDVCGYIGFDSPSNTVFVVGSESVWSNAAALCVGHYGVGNNLTIASGGVVLCNTGFIGNVICSVSNTVLVNGAGSLWSNSMALHVGSTGSFNKLSITDSGTVSAPVVVAGFTPAFSSNNLLQVSRGNLWTTNAAGTGLLEVRSGTLNLSGGSLWLNTLSFGTNGMLVDDGTSLLTFVGGSPNISIASGTRMINSGIQGSGAMLTTGEGVLVLNGSNSFNGLITVSNAALNLTHACALGAVSAIEVDSGSQLRVLATNAINPAATVNVHSGGSLYVTNGLALTVNELFLDGVAQADGTWGPLGSGATHVDSRFQGAAVLNVTNTVATTYALTASGGTGGGRFTAGSLAYITAQTSLGGYVFDHWRVDAGSPTIGDVNAASTTLTMPAGDVTVVAVFKPVYGALAGGNYHSVALKTNGTVWAWGWNFYGQLGDGTSTDRNSPVQVAGLANVIAISSEYDHTVALKSDGTVWTWGRNSYGQLGDGTTTNRANAVQVSGLSNVVAVAAGGSHTVALKSDGTVWAWGWNGYGQLGDGTTTNRANAVQVSGLSNVRAIVAGGGFTMALKLDGTVWTWGANDYGQLGDGSVTQRTGPVQVSGLSNVTAVAGGYVHTVALKSDGTVWTWGSNSSGQLGDGTATNRTSPVQVSGLTNVTAIATGNIHTMALKTDGTIWTCGLNNYGQLGDGTIVNRLTPVEIGGLDLCGYLTLKVNGGNGGGGYGSGAGTTITAVMPAGYLFDHWQVDSGSPTIADVHAASTTLTMPAGDVTVSAQYRAIPYTLTVNNGSGGGSYCVGAMTPIIATAAATGYVFDHWQVDSGNPTLGALDYSSVMLTMPASDVTVTAIYRLVPYTLTVGSGSGGGTNNTMGAVVTITAAPPAFGYAFDHWVINSGAPTIANLASPSTSLTIPAGDVSVQAAYKVWYGAIAAGSSHSVALKPDGTVWSWGYNHYGQLGDGTVVDHSTPVQVSGLTNIIAIAAGFDHTLALKSDGTVWAWGGNQNGQLGDGTTVDNHSPLQVSGLSGVIAVACGGLHSMALKSDGTVWAWGLNGYGELGDGTTAERHLPVPVSGLSGVSAIATATYHTVALKTDGTVRTWGWNMFGELGDGTTTDRHVPVQVSGLSAVSAVVAGQMHTVAMKTDGTVWCWGYNSNGQLGDGTTTDRHVPVQVSGLSSVSAVVAESSSTMALKTDGTVWTWGWNQYGQLGDGTTTARSVPTQTTGLSLGVIIINGTNTNISGDYWVGNSAAFNGLIVTNSGVLTVAGKGYIGNSTLSSNNFAVVTGAGSLWTNAGYVYVGNTGGFNRLTVNNGGQVNAGEYTYVGMETGSVMNAVVVDGANSVLRDHYFYLGNSGAGNTLTITNGGKVDVSSIGMLGYNSSSTNNSLVVTGPGSVWSNGTSGSLNVGIYGGGNRLVVANGGKLFCSECSSVGEQSAGNSILVTGAGSCLYNEYSLHVGTGGSGNQLTIADGGHIIQSNAWSCIGFGTANNTVLVTDSGSVWRQDGIIMVGYGGGGGNQLIITNFGAVIATNVAVGDAWTTSSRLRISNGTLTVTNGQSSGLLDIEGGTVSFNGGSLLLNNLLVNTNGSYTDDSTGVLTLVGSGGCFSER